LSATSRTTVEAETVIESGLCERGCASRWVLGSRGEADFADQLLSVRRNQFGGHTEIPPRPARNRSRGRPEPADA
jgi:6-phosphogluconate dehydrogenase (decarboxylating)